MKHQDIRSAQKNFDEFCIVNEEIVNFIDIIVLTETWVLQDVSLSNISGYNGKLLYVKTKIQHSTKIIQMKEYKLLQAINESVSVATSYRPPSTRAEFIVFLSAYLQKIRQMLIHNFVGNRYKYRYY